MEQNDWTLFEVYDSHKRCLILLRKNQVSAQKHLMFHQALDAPSPVLWECDLTDSQLEVNVVWE